MITAAGAARGHRSAAIALAMFAIVFFRLWYLQVLSGDQYVHPGANRVRDRIAAPRGQIVDRKATRSCAAHDVRSRVPRRSRTHAPNDQAPSSAQTRDARALVDPRVTPGVARDWPSQVAYGTAPRRARQTG